MAELRKFLVAVAQFGVQFSTVVDDGFLAIGYNHRVDGAKVDSSGLVSWFS